MVVPSNTTVARYWCGVNAQLQHAPVWQPPYGWRLTDPSRGGSVPRAALIAFPADSTHGYQIAHLGAIANCVRLVTALTRDRPVV